jgi:hypothetical protein
MEEQAINTDMMEVEENNQTNEKKYQKEEVLKYKDKELILGESWYIIDNTWYENWKNYVKYDTEFEDELTCESPGVIDNKNLFLHNGKLKYYITVMVDYIFVPEEVGKLFYEW